VFPASAGVFISFCINPTVFSPTFAYAGQMLNRISIVFKLLIGFLLSFTLCINPICAQAQSTEQGGTDARRIAKARDAVMPVVVSILVVRQDYQQGEPSLSVSSGSGTVISPQGFIATNAHVTQNGKSFRVVFSNGRELPATLVGTDTASDIAVLKAVSPDNETFAFAKFAENLNDLTPGDTVLAMGAPWGLSNSMSAGVVNNPRRLLVSLFDDEADYEDRLGADEPTGRYYAWIQHDAAIAPGNSGGPLVDLNGKIVGVNTRGMISGGDLAFAIPGPDVAKLVEQMIAKGKVDRIALGFRLRSLKGTNYQEGVLINAVERKSQAEKAGLFAGDRILRLNGEVVTALQPVDVPMLQRRIAELPVNSDVVLEIERNEKTQTIKLKANALPLARGDDYATEAFGMSVTELTSAMSKRRNLDEDSGLLITGIRPGGAAAIARPKLQPGDIIRKIQSQRVSDVAQLKTLSAQAKSSQFYLFEIERDDEKILALLKPEADDKVRVPLPELAKSWSGVEVQPISTSLAKDMGNATAGYRITRAYPNSPMIKAGAKIGDIVTTLQGEPLKPANDVASEPFHQAVRDIVPDTDVAFQVVRDAKTIALNVKFMPSPISSAGLKTQNLNRLRVEIRELGFYDRVNAQLSSAQQGVILDGVEAGGPAGLAHLQRSDIITRVGYIETPNLETLVSALDQSLNAKSKTLIPINVIRGNESRVVYLDPYWLNGEIKN
jgi:S1-C subfamily serine protease